MQTELNHSLSSTGPKCTPVGQVLERIAHHLKKERGAAVLEQSGPIQQLAVNTYKIRYSVRHPDANGRFSLAFTIAGPDADLILLEAQEGPDGQAHPGQVDLRVYRLDRIQEIQEAVQQKVRVHLNGR
jgi:hypothetical protein